MNNLTFTAQRVLRFLDLTRLNDNDNEQEIISLCRKAQNIAGNTAAICIYPYFIPIARKILDLQNNTSIRIATVTNFPHGRHKLTIAIQEICSAIAYGANEIDMVFPYQSLIAGNENIGFTMVKEASELCQNKHVLLKVIIECGELQHANLIRCATNIVIAGGANFIKTSTGKTPINATLTNAEIILKTIIEQNAEKRVGLKVSGGIRTVQEATAYLDLTDKIMGVNWINLQNFRIGASSLLDDILRIINQDSHQKPQNLKHIN
ncbi:deoxyribose-phosphate aldolase [Candidatus Curculioniphilus buchneri]|uniref:deoxyribose-phosphate aldolase n=1 Tax=Candidatus Curculioniphilus buchneri TaxID=690594 RepID=UPI00376F26A1